MDISKQNVTELTMTLKNGVTIKALEESDGLSLWIGDQCVAYLDGFYANENTGEADKLPLMIHRTNGDGPIMRVDFYPNRTTFDVLNTGNQHVQWNTSRQNLVLYNGD